MPRDPCPAAHLPEMRERGSKPPFIIPSLSEIVALPWNGFTVASTFSGCGGSSLGYRMAGFRVLWANEFVEEAFRCYAANKAPDTILDGRDIRDIRPEHIFEACRIGPGELDLLDGSPPCAAFSSAGTRHAGWGKEKAYSDRVQRVDDLFFEFARILDGVQPRTFVAENVSGLVKGTAKGYFLTILQALKKCGYRVGAKVLDGQWLAVPQGRQRLIFVGVREDLGLDPVHPRPLPYRYSVREALPHIAMMQTGSYCSEWRVADEPMGTICQSDGARAHRAAVQTKDGRRRKWTIGELKVICGFPADFVLTGSYEQQWERLGRAVPPVMMAHVAATIRDRILNPARAGRAG